MRNPHIVVAALATLYSHVALAQSGEVDAAGKPREPGGPSQPAAPAETAPTAGKPGPASPTTPPEAKAPEAKAPQAAPPQAAPPPTQAQTAPAGTTEAAVPPEGAASAPLPDEDAPEEPPAPAPEPARPVTAPAPDARPPSIDPQQDAAQLAAQGGATAAPDATGVTAGAAPAARAAGAPTYAEDWWTHTRPVLELHGGFRSRGEMFHNFNLGRRETPNESLWARPADQRYGAGNQQTFGPALCTANETDAVSFDSSDPRDGLFSCDNNTQAGANLRLRLNPEIHISDNVRIRSQIDLLDNLVLGSTPDGFRYTSGAEGFTVAQRSGYNQLSFFDATQVPPDSQANSFSDSVRVKRVWGEYSTPLGEVRFGRMPNHFGLGMVHNSGDTYDADYQSTVDRALLSTTFSALDLTVSAMWDFVSEGATDTIDIPGSQPYDRAQLDDVTQYGLMLLKQKDAQLERLALARENVVINGGLYVLYRNQTLADDQSLSAADGGPVPGANLDNQAGNYARRDAYALTPDLWLQLKYKGFRAELEAAGIFGRIASPSIGPNTEAHFQTGNPAVNIRQFGGVLQLEQKLVEDRLRLGFDFGFASGDGDALEPGIPGSLVPTASGTEVEDNTLSTFRFHPGYRVDLILNRNILQRVQGSYYFRPGLEYDFLRDSRGQRAGGGVRAIWTRATKTVQTPGKDADLGVELNATLYYQARDGSLNDDVDTMGGFYSALQYGVLFPLAGLGYTPEEKSNITGSADVSAAQILRLQLGILF